MRTVTIEKTFGKIEEFDAETQEKIFDNFRKSQNFVYYMYDETETEIDCVKNWIKEAETDFEINQISICEDYGWNVAISGYSKDNEKFLGYCLQNYSGSDEKLLIRFISDCDFYIDLSFRNHHSLYQEIDCNFPDIIFSHSQKVEKRVSKIEDFILNMADQYVRDMLHKYENAMAESVEYYESDENLLEYFSINEYEIDTETLEIA